MTAVWLIILTVIAVAIVPTLLIYYTTVHPFLQAHPPKITLYLIPLLPDISLTSFFSINTI